MKLNFLFVLASATILWSCGGSSASSNGPVSGDITKDPAYQKGLSLIGKSDCATCHKVEENVTGPSYQAIAQKYASATDAELSRVAQKIINGGSGHWGEIPMTPHPGLKADEASAMVQYIMLLKK